MYIEEEEYAKLLEIKEKYERSLARSRQYQLKNRKKITEYHNRWERERRERKRKYI